MVTLDYDISLLAAIIMLQIMYKCNVEQKNSNRK